MKKLPTVGTSAGTTVFCTAEIVGDDGRSLWMDGNGKITRDNGTLDAPKPNAFSLPAQAVTNARLATIGVAPYTHDDCPGSTTTCRSTCYVGGLEKHAADTYALYERNAIAIREILADPEIADKWAARVALWMLDSVSSFRWHVSGDVYSAEYARWIALVCRLSPTVEHWIYTRSFDPEILGALASVSTLRGGNLAVNVSCDVDNYEAARAVALAHGDISPAELDAMGWGSIGTQPLRLCYLTVDGAAPADLPEGSVIFPDYGLRGGTEAGRAWFAALTADQKSMVCPVDFGGKSDKRRCGPCDRCLT